MNKPQVIASLGPSSETPDMLPKLIDAGMDVVRLNFSHGTHAEYAGDIALVRKLAGERGIVLPIIQDLSGPRMKTESGHKFDETVHGCLTEKDINDLEFGLAQKCEYIALSYVGAAGDVQLLREKIQSLGNSGKIIAKIERQEAIDDFDAILEASDAIMVARGDLGLAIPVEEIPFVERDLVMRSKKRGKPVIVATQMEFSMINAPEPTRAEVTDIAYAVLSGADVVMLSDETTTGHYPLQAVSFMARVVARSAREITTPVNRL